jgi:hypothetical protein
LGIFPGIVDDFFWEGGYIGWNGLINEVESRNVRKNLMEWRFSCYGTNSLDFCRPGNRLRVFLGCIDPAPRKPVEKIGVKPNGIQSTPNFGGGFYPLWYTFCIKPTPRLLAST